MPCRDYYDDHPDEYYADTVRDLKKQIAFAESALCQVLAALEIVDQHVETISPKQGEWYDWINFAAAGITKDELKKWHKKHKALDEKHRAEEKKAALKKSALSKLTAEERQALGVK
jgi:predicted DNA binding protein